jgi:Replication initiator protein A
LKNKRRRRMGDTQDLQLVRVEINLEEFPVFLPRKAMRRGSYAFERTIEGENGTRLDQKWSVISSSETTLPGRFDQDVFIGVLELLERRGGMPPNGTLEFSVYELAAILDVRIGGKTYGEIKDSLVRIAMTSIRSENAFWSNGQKRHITDTFRLWDVTFDESQNRKGERRSRHCIEFGKLFMRSFHDHYLRGLDTELYWMLDSPVAKRLYRLIDHKRDSSGTWETSLKELQSQLPIGPYRYAAKIREKLAGPHAELLKAGFLSEVRCPDRDRVSYVVAEDFRKVREELELTGTREELIAIQLLTHSGLRGDVARDLVAKFGPEHCTRYANALPYQKALRNPAGWLRRAIEEAYELPHPSQPELPTSSGTPPARSDRTGVSDKKHPTRGTSTQEPHYNSPVSIEENTASLAWPAPPSDQSEQTSEEPIAPDSRAKSEWDALVKSLVALRGHDSLPPWFEQFQGGQLEECTLTVVVPNSYAANHLNENFGEDLVRLWRERSGEEGAVVQVTTDLSSGVRARLCVDA